MFSDRSIHLSDEQLCQFDDGELGEQEARHIASCPACSKRLEDMRAATQSYVEYRDSNCRPLLPPPPKRWPSLSELVEQQHGAGRKSIIRWWPLPAVAAACIAVVLTITYGTVGQSSARAAELLSRSAAVELPAERLIAVRLQGQSLIRPAVLIQGGAADEEPSFGEVRSAFVAARYSWQEPLSARSFQAWRGGLKHKRDSVSVVRGPHDVESYRVRTEAPNGVLQSASLTLRQRDLRPTNASFEFEKLGTVEVGEVPPPVDKPVASQPPASPQKPVAETPAGPADTLRVLAALNRIGADVGEPIDVSLDAQRGRVLVRSQEITAERRQQLASALGRMPRVVLEFRSGVSAGPEATHDSGEKYQTDIPTPLRIELESKFGSALAFQVVTDRVLDHSGSMLAQAHALQVLAIAFQPDTEEHLIASDRILLQSLRQNHISELARWLTQIRTDLSPLFSATPQKSERGAAETWQEEARALMTEVQETDKLLNRLLAGSYSQPAGEEMLRVLPFRIAQLDATIRSQYNAGK